MTNLHQLPASFPSAKLEPPPLAKLLDVLLDHEGRRRVTREICDVARNMRDWADKEVFWNALVEKYVRRMEREGASREEMKRALKYLSNSVKSENARRDEVARSAVKALDPFFDLDFKIEERGRILKFPADVPMSESR